MTTTEETMRTSWTLVARVKNREDQDSWREFYDFYRGLIAGVARRAGLTESEAEDAVQETMLSVSRSIQQFVASPERGSFRAWLLKLAGWRIQDQLRKRLPLEAGGSPATSSSTTPTIERAPDGNEPDWAGLCDAEWRERLARQALRELRVKVKAEHYQVFYLVAVEGKSVSEAAGMVGRSKAQVYLIRHRVAKTLRAIVKRLEKRLE